MRLKETLVDSFIHVTYIRVKFAKERLYESILITIGIFISIFFTSIGVPLFIQAVFTSLLFVMDLVWMYLDKKMCERWNKGGK